MAEKKITKREKFVEIIEILTDAERADLVECVQHEIELLDKKAAKAKETAAKKKTETDELADAIAAVLTDEFTAIPDIATRVDGEDVTVAKVTNRLTKLVNLGIAEKEQISVPGAEGKTRKVMGYRKAAVDAE